MIVFGDMSLFLFNMMRCRDMSPGRELQVKSSLEVACRSEMSIFNIVQESDYIYFYITFDVFLIFTFDEPKSKNAYRSSVVCRIV